MEDNRIWVDKLVLDWCVRSQSSSETSHKDRMRAYELWNHAESILNSNNDELHRVDAISTLKRCLNQRLKFIEYVYGFREISLDSSPKGYLELLETFNLVRPLMLKKLMTIRNDIEHNDAEPPSIERCLELPDLSWYFLKSTDGFLAWRQDDFIYYDVDDNGRETQYWINIAVDFDLNHKFNVRGWVPNEIVAMEPFDGAIELFVDSIGKNKDRWPNKSIHEDKLDNDIYFRGILGENSKFKHQVLRDALSIF
ncbi:hypothetical protein ACJJID_18155 [Microbulbifer sp. CnH-101-G]|uniref:hypothetical protein n=1 Tax=Microbulbifer sp. CnH-101-G TaxID=3243393 RepID=UPI0040393051